MLLRYISYYFTLTALVVVGSVVLYLINVTEDSTYVDEIFHVKQCEEYCKGNFHKYDPKITTPPGLYIITISILLPLSTILRTNLCSLSIFRTISFTVSLILFELIHRILNLKIQKKNTDFICCYEFMNGCNVGSPDYPAFSSRQVQRSRVKEPWFALNLTTLPVLYFVSFLYYTDVMSVFFVLMTYYLYKTNRSHSAGFVGFLSVTVRQNNVLWFTCFAFMKCCQNIEWEMSKNGKSVKETDRKKLSYTLVIMNESFSFMRHSFWSFSLMVLRETYWLLATIVIFIALVVSNGSLVLGDKTSHEAVVHIPQLFYFSLFTFIFSFPHFIYPCIELMRSNRKTKVVLLLSALVATIIVSVNTMAHIFLLSDNRHYTFYIWKRIFEKPFGKFLPIPVYVVSIYGIFRNLYHVEGYTKMGYLISTMLSLIPHKLLEFRYFMVPYLLFNIEIGSRVTGWQLALQLIFNILINYLTLNVFLWSPFRWPDGSIQRFSW